MNGRGLAWVQCQMNIERRNYAWIQRENFPQIFCRLFHRGGHSNFHHGNRPVQGGRTDSHRFGLHAHQDSCAGPRKQAGYVVRRKAGRYQSPFGTDCNSQHVFRWRRRLFEGGAIKGHFYRRLPCAHTRQVSGLREHSFNRFVRRAPGFHRAKQ